MRRSRGCILSFRQALPRVDLLQDRRRQLGKVQVQVGHLEMLCIVQAAAFSRLLILCQPNESPTDRSH